MLKFSEYPYQPIDIEKISKDLSSYISEFKSAKNAKKQIEIIQKINDYRSEVETNMSIANVRFTINTADKYYLEQKNIIEIGRAHV